MDHSKKRRGDRYDSIIRSLASIICLAVAVYSFWTTRDLVTFLILIGIAIDPRRIWQAIGWSEPRKRLGSRAQENTPAAEELKQDIIY